MRVDAGSADRKLDAAVGSQAIELDDADPVKLQAGMLGGYADDGSASADTAIVGAGNLNLSKAGDSDDAVFPSLGGILGVFRALASPRRRSNRKGGGESAVGDTADVTNPDGIKDDEMSFQIVGQKRSGLGSCGHSSSLQGSCTVCNRLIRLPGGGDASETQDHSQTVIAGSQIR